MTMESLSDAIRRRVESYAVVQDATAEWERVKDQLDSLEAEARELEREAEDLEEKIRAAQEAGDADAPIRQWSREARELRGEVEDIRAERPALETLLERKKHVLAEARAEATAEILAKQRKEAAEAGEKIREAFETIRQAVADLDGLSTPMTLAFGFHRVSCEESGQAVRADHDPIKAAGFRPDELADVEELIAKYTRSFERRRAA